MSDASDLGDVKSSVRGGPISWLVFGGLSLGQLTAAEFATGSAIGTSAQVVYDTTTGALGYAANGAAGSTVQFATLTGAPTLTPSHVTVV